jgi:hypothetical protein
MKDNNTNNPSSNKFNNGLDCIYVPLEMKLETLKKLFQNPFTISEQQYFDPQKMPKRFLPDVYSSSSNQSESLMAKRLKAKFKNRFRKVIKLNKSGPRKSEDNSKVIFLIRGDKLQIILDTLFDDNTVLYQWISFEQIPKTLIEYIREDFSEFVLTTIQVPRALVESAIPDMFKPHDVYSRTKGDYYHPEDLEKIIKNRYEKDKNNFTYLFPLLVDIIRYLRVSGKQYFTNEPPVIIKHNKRGAKEKYYIIAVDSLTELIGKGINRRGRLAALKELHLLKKPVFFTFKKGASRGWEYFEKGFSLPANTLEKEIRSLKSNGFIETDLEEYRYKKHILFIPSLVLDIKNKESRKKHSYVDLPNIRKVLEPLKYLESYHRKAIMWGFLQSIKQKETPRLVNKLLHEWGIDEDKNHPARRDKRISECLAFLVQSGLVFGYRKTKNKQGEQKFIFNMNSFMSKQYIDFSRKAEFEADDDDDRD